MKITDKQKELLKNFDIKIEPQINDLLNNIDDKITEIGFNDDYSLNEDGLKLQLLYDQLYNQN